MRPAAPAPRATSLRPTARDSWIAELARPTRVWTAPGSGRVAGRQPAVSPWGGGPVGLMVLERREDGAGRVWLRVRLAERPNDAAGWIRADFAHLRRTRWRIEVSTGRRLVRLLRDGRVVDRYRAVIGAPDTPTPRGQFAIAERIRQPAGGFLGAWALHLTAHSDVLDDYGGGPGRVAIHGRGGASLQDPLGTARSHGCIRVDDAAVRRLARVAIPGTPVRIGA